MIQIVGTALVFEHSLIPVEETVVQIPVLLWTRKQSSSTRMLPEIMLC